MNYEPSIGTRVIVRGVHYTNHTATVMENNEAMRGIGACFIRFDANPEWVGANFAIYWRDLEELIEGPDAIEEMFA